MNIPTAEQRRLTNVLKNVINQTGSADPAEVLTEAQKSIQQQIARRERLLKELQAPAALELAAQIVAEGGAE